MLLKYEVEFDNQVILQDLNKLTNQVYKLLPTREEGSDWRKPLETINEEIAGISRLFPDQQATFFTLLSKLEGLFTLTEDSDFLLYRRIIFECLGLIREIAKVCQD